MSKELVIAIDGPAGAGKSTVARHIALELGYTYVDTGAMYRAMTLYLLEQQIPFIQSEQLAKSLADINLEYIQGRIVLNGKDVTEAIRAPHVTSQVSHLAKLPLVRNFLIKMQRLLALEGGVVMDGRDVGTVVLPNADIKIFLTASLEERARRRQLEWSQKDINMGIEQIMADLRQRDKLDTEREISPLRPADDAIIINSTQNDVQEVVNQIVALCKEVGRV